MGQDVDPGIWPYHLFRVDCLVSIYGRSWVGKLFVGEDNRQNRETIIGIRKNRNPDWDISRIAEYAVAHYNLGFALVAEGKNEEAISHYKMAIKLNPDYAAAHNNLGNALSAERNAFNCECERHDLLARKMQGHDVCFAAVTRLRTFIKAIECAAQR